MRRHTIIFVDFWDIAGYPVVTNWHAQGEQKWVAVMPIYYFLKSFAAQNDNDWFPGIA